MSDISIQHAPEPGEPAVTQRSRRISLVWLVPVVAALVGLSMLIHAWLSTGPDITITFQAATGLEAGKTAVKYKDVTVGVVSSIALSDDGSKVLAVVSLDKSAASLARADTRFWVVRPRISSGGVSGIDTLLSGAYIGVDKGSSKHFAKTFKGLENPPTVINGTPGSSFALHTDDLGSLDIGSPVYYRQIQVGRVAAYKLDADGRGVGLQVFVNAPYDRFVTQDTRFWNASGIDVSLGADGLKLNTQSLATVVAGGIAFATTPIRDRESGVRAPSNFILFKDRQTAMAPPNGPSLYLQLRFEQSLRGLSVGAPVQFAGFNIGQVVSVDLDYDSAKQLFPAIVGIEIYPQRLGRVLAKLPTPSGDKEHQAAEFLSGMVAHGLRAQARSGNLLTGQLYVSLDFMPKAPKVDFDVDARPITLPTINGSLDQLQEQVANIIGKIEKMPLEAIGRHIDAALSDLDKTLKQVNGQVLPTTTQTLQEAKQTLGVARGTLAEDAPLQQNLTDTLQEVKRAATSLRVLSDLLSRHPEALLRGLPSDPKPNPSATESVRTPQEHHP